MKVSLLRRGVADLDKLPVREFVQSLEIGPAPDWFPPWGWGTRALLAFRSGDPKLAIRCAERSEALSVNERQHAFNLTILAMANHQLGDSEKSRTAFEQAGEIIRELPANGMDQDVLMARIIFTEAESLLNEAGDR